MARKVQADPATGRFSPNGNHNVVKAATSRARQVCHNFGEGKWACPTAWLRNQVNCHNWILGCAWIAEGRLRQIEPKLM